MRYRRPTHRGGRHRGRPTRTRTEGRPAAVSQHHPHHVQQQSGPPPRPGRAWWWLPEHERRRRREQRRAREEWKRRNKRTKGDNDCCDACDCLGEIADPCMIALIPIMFASVLKAAVGRGHGRSAADPAAPVPAGPLAAGLYDAVRFYRTRISPTRAACCPYTPSCSTYAVQALHRHGAVRGSRLTAGRLLRCRPGTHGGHDPVPGR